MGFSDVLNVISIIVTIFSFFSEHGKKTIKFFGLKVSIFKPKFILVSIILLFLLRLIIFVFANTRYFTPFLILNVMLRPLLYEIIFSILLAYLCFRVIKMIKKNEELPSKSTKQRVEFIAKNIENKFEFNWFKPYVYESLSDLITYGGGNNCILKQKSNRILNQLLESYFDDLEKEGDLIQNIISQIHISYKNGCSEKYGCINKIVERAFLNSNSILWKQMAHTQDLSKNNLARFLLSYEAFSKKQDIICLLHRHHNEFNTENIDSYINFMKYFIQLFFSDKTFQSRCFFEDNLKFYFEQYNDITTDSLNVTYKKIWDLYADFVSKALNDLYFDYSFVHDIIMRYYFEYIEKIYMIYPHKEDLGFEMRSRRMYKTLIENWYYSHTQEIFNHIKKKIENFCLNNIHYLRWFFICEQLGNSPYSFINSIWNVIQENFPRWYDENPDMAISSLPAWVSYDCNRKVLERHPLVGNRRKVIATFQCM